MPIRNTLSRVLLCLVLGTQAAAAASLYEAEVPVAGSDAGSRTAALRQALTQVLVKVSGRRDVGNLPGIAAAGRLVQQYRYGVAPRTGGQTLWARFDSDAVERLLQGAGVPVWSGERPDLLVWLAVQDGGRRSLLGSDSIGGVSTALRAQAERRGLPVLLPLLDLEDRSRIAAGDVWGGFQDRIIAASARYGTNVLLVGRLSHDSEGGWTAHWTFYEKPNGRGWDTQGTLDAVLGAGIDGVADALSGRFSAPGAQAGGLVGTPLDLRVRGVHNLDDYARLTQYLRKLALVADLQVTAVAPNEVDLRLGVRGSPDALLQAIGMESMLLPAGGGGEGSPRVYRWLR